MSGIIERTNTLDEWRIDYNLLISEVGDVSILTTVDTTAVGAINELDAEIGDVSTLTTTATTVVTAINELDGAIDALASVAFSGSYNDLSDLPTLGTASEQDVAYFALASHTHDYETDITNLPYLNNVTVIADSGDTKDLSGTLGDYPQSIDFNADESKLYVGDGATSTVKQFSISVPGDFTNITYDAISLDVSTYLSDIDCIKFADSGNKIYVSGRMGGQYLIVRYDCSTPYDLTTAVYNSSTTDYGRSILSFDFSLDGTKLFIMTSEFIREYSPSVAWGLSISSIDYSIPSLYIFGSNPNKYFTFNSDHTGIYALVTVNGLRYITYFSLDNADSISTYFYDQNYASSAHFALLSIRYSNVFPNTLYWSEYLAKEVGYFNKENAFIGNENYSDHFASLNSVKVLQSQIGFYPLNTTATQISDAINELNSDFTSLTWTTLSGKPSRQTIAYSATIAPNATLNKDFITTLTGDLTLNKPTGANAQDTVSIAIVQDGTGSHTLTLGTGVSFASYITDTALSTDPGSVDVLLMMLDPSGATTNWVIISFIKGEF